MVSTRLRAHTLHGSSLVLGESIPPNRVMVPALWGIESSSPVTRGWHQLRDCVIERWTHGLIGH